jgi:hypothetical protein
MYDGAESGKQVSHSLAQFVGDTSALLVILSDKKDDWN